MPDMTAAGLYKQIQNKKSFLCVGLDTDIGKIPRHLHLLESPVLEFNKKIIDATHDLAIAYKPNLAFYEARGADGWNDLKKTVEYIRSVAPEVFLIADAKRGDIGNTGAMYAKAFFEEMDFDAITLSPYMGKDTVTPFLEYDGKWVILLGLTSNPGAEDFQFFPAGSGPERLFEEVIRQGAEWGGPDQVMFVAGATRAGLISDIRRIIPKHFLLVPGIGAQGGSLKEVVDAGLNEQCGLIINASRSILYAGSDEAFDQTARIQALALQEEMAALLS
jgi:orotidine-5'-phosphate decarboxylase